MGKGYKFPGKHITFDALCQGRAALALTCEEAIAETYKDIIEKQFNIQPGTEAHEIIDDIFALMLSRDPISAAGRTRFVDQNKQRLQALSCSSKLLQSQADNFRYAGDETLMLIMANPSTLEPDKARPTTAFSNFWQLLHEVTASTQASLLGSPLTRAICGAMDISNLKYANRILVQHAETANEKGETDTSRGRTDYLYRQEGLVAQAAADFFFRGTGLLDEEDFMTGDKLRTARATIPNVLMLRLAKVGLYDGTQESLQTFEDALNDYFLWNSLANGSAFWQHPKYTDEGLTGFGAVWAFEHITPCHLPLQGDLGAKIKIRKCQENLLSPAKRQNLLDGGSIQLFGRPITLKQIVRSENGSILEKILADEELSEKAKGRGIAPGDLPDDIIDMYPVLIPEETLEYQATKAATTRIKAAQDKVELLPGVDDHFDAKQLYWVKTIAAFVKAAGHPLEEFYNEKSEAYKLANLMGEIAMYIEPVRQIETFWRDLKDLGKNNSNDTKLSKPRCHYNTGRRHDSGFQTVFIPLQDGKTGVLTIAFDGRTQANADRNLGETGGDVLVVTAANICATMMQKLCPNAQTPEDIYKAVLRCSNILDGWEDAAGLNHSKNPRYGNTETGAPTFFHFKALEKGTFSDATPLREIALWHEANIDELEKRLAMNSPSRTLVDPADFGLENMKPTIRTHVQRQKDYTSLSAGISLEKGAQNDNPKQAEGLLKKFNKWLTQHRNPLPFFNGRQQNASSTESQLIANMGLDSQEETRLMKNLIQHISAGKLSPWRNGNIFDELCQRRADWCPQSDVDAMMLAAIQHSQDRQ